MMSSIKGPTDAQLALSNRGGARSPRCLPSEFTARSPLSSLDTRPPSSCTPRSSKPVG